MPQRKREAAGDEGEGPAAEGDEGGEGNDQGLGDEPLVRLNGQLAAILSRSKASLL